MTIASFMNYFAYVPGLAMPPIQQNRLYAPVPMQYSISHGRRKPGHGAQDWGGYARRLLHSRTKR